MSEIGDKVGAVSHEEDGIFYFFGWGTFQGREVPPEGIIFGGHEICKLPPPYNKVPKIVLKSGKVVWGSECYWGEERFIREMMVGREVVLVDPTVERRKK